MKINIKTISYLVFIFELSPILRLFYQILYTDTYEAFGILFMPIFLAIPVAIVGFIVKTITILLTKTSIRKKDNKKIDFNKTLSLPFLTSLIAILVNILFVPLVNIL